jgi:hypothetical protein
MCCQVVGAELLRPPAMKSLKRAKNKIVTKGDIRPAMEIYSIM